ncbi:unnamed protein product [Peniophora sp. CBMAI 1063]|nr:unnamed protein product [Peniophora sp. CBMAI 1063]
MPDNLAHIVSQTRQNVEHLVAEGQLSRSDGNVILNRLPTASDVSVRALSDSTRRLVISGNSTSLSRMPAGFNNRSATPPAPAPTRRTQPAKALWSYNEDGAEPNDLSFRGGDIIVITDETNADWWTGQHNGREGLFPANFVEKITRSSSSPARAAASSRAIPAQTPTPPSSAGYASPPPQTPGYGAPPPQGYGGPPPPQAYGGPPPPQNYGPPVQYQPYPPPQPPPPQGQVVVVEAPQQQSRGFFSGGGGGGGSGFGSLLATSAVGGLGFGVGAGIAENVVDAIF